MNESRSRDPHYAPASWARQGKRSNDAPTFARTGMVRHTHRRTDERLLNSLWKSDGARCFLISNGQTIVRRNRSEGLDIVTFSPTSEEAWEGGQRYYLGDDSSGLSYFSVRQESLDKSAAGATWLCGLREGGELLSSTQVGLLVHAVSLDNWHERHRFCPRCGSMTVSAAWGHMRYCPACSAEHYPTSDPAVMALVVDAEERVLLGHRRGWPTGRLSLIAGFVDPGESLESAVAREAAEDYGVRIERVCYAASEPWPFPTGLMIGFIARAESHDSGLTLDGDEVDEAVWASRDRFRRMIETGEMLKPLGSSLAAQLIESWYGQDLPSRQF
ncbi:NAD(+) diphosphatase [Spongiactinospora sp. 9N601]|uniref:NAD(+) diphosphatase n=1 Tax=Spongiactinospora sp. 9N601 TaxID=3375149 RepID=UPI0037880C6F